MNKHDFRPIIGQEAICPDGLGRVSDYKLSKNSSRNIEWVEIETYIRNRSCKWDAENVELIDPRKH